MSFSIDNWAFGNTPIEQAFTRPLDIGLNRWYRHERIEREIRSANGHAQRLGIPNLDYQTDHTGWGRWSMLGGGLAAGQTALRHLLATVDTGVSTITRENMDTPRSHRSSLIPG